MKVPMYHLRYIVLLHMMNKLLSLFTLNRRLTKRLFLILDIKRYRALLYKKIY
jgi:hypothetical protein